MLMRLDRVTNPPDLIAVVDVHGPVHGRSTIRWWGASCHMAW